MEDCPIKVTECGDRCEAEGGRDFKFRLMKYSEMNFTMRKMVENFLLHVKPAGDKYLETTLEWSSKSPNGMLLHDNVPSKRVLGYFKISVFIRWSSSLHYGH